MMLGGYALCTPDQKKVLAMKKNGKGVELINIEKTENLNRALCLRDLTSIKNIYERLRKMKLIEELDIVNIAKLYKNRY